MNCEEAGGSSYAVSSSEASVQADGTGAILPNGTNELTERKILAAEYFIETDPGEGSGLTIDAEDLVYDQATEQLNNYRSIWMGWLVESEGLGYGYRMIREIGQPYPLLMSTLRTSLLWRRMPLPIPRSIES